MAEKTNGLENGHGSQIHLEMLIWTEPLLKAWGIIAVLYPLLELAGQCFVQV